MRRRCSVSHLVYDRRKWLAPTIVMEYIRMTIEYKMYTRSVQNTTSVSSFFGL
jgi:predicted YcjX-like family ATPase